MGDLIYSGEVRHSSAGFKMLSTTHDPRKCVLLLLLLLLLLRNSGWLLLWTSQTHLSPRLAPTLIVHQKHGNFLDFFWQRISSRYRRITRERRRRHCETLGDELEATALQRGNRLHCTLLFGCFVELFRWRVHEVGIVFANDTMCNVQGLTSFSTAAWVHLAELHTDALVRFVCCISDRLAALGVFAVVLHCTCCNHQ